MKGLDFGRYTLTICAAAAVLSGCGALRQAQDDTPPIVARGAVHSATAGPNLYVANYSYGGQSTVTVYAPDSEQVLRTISRGLSAAYSLAFDGSGNLFVGNLSDSDPNGGV